MHQRYQVGQKLWVMFAHVTNSQLYPLRVAYTPWNYGHVLPKVEFLELEVTEHHRVRSEWDNTDAEPQYDGYLLRDTKGNVWSNQYPRAAYSQTSTAADQDFSRYFGDDAKAEWAALEEFEKTISYGKEACDPNPKELPFIPEMRLFLDELNEIKHGVHFMKKRDENTEVLEAYYEHVLSSFSAHTSLAVLCEPLKIGDRVIEGRFRHHVRDIKEKDA